MKLFLDKYAKLDSPIHRWEIRSKLVSLLALIFSFSFVNQLFLLPLMVIVTANLFSLSRLPFKFLLSRLRYPGLFILALVIFLPFVAGDTVILQLGILQIKQEGCLQVLLIITRFVCILTVSLVLFATAPFLTTIQAMRSLFLPDIIVDMMLLTYRYLEELGDTRITMQRAIKMRGFQSKNLSKRNLQVIASLIGSLLVRSYEQSKRVYQAMILRGYTSDHLTMINKSHPNKMSLLASSIIIIIAVIIVGLSIVFN